VNPLFTAALEVQDLFSASHR